MEKIIKNIETGEEVVYKLTPEEENEFLAMQAELPTIIEPDQPQP